MRILFLPEPLPLVLVQNLSKQQLFPPLIRVPLRHQHPILLVPIGAALVAKYCPASQSGLLSSLYWDRGLKRLAAGPGNASQVS